MEKQKKIAVIGLGQFGMAVCKHLVSRGIEVLAIDRDLDRVEMIKDEVAYAVTLDSTDIKTLRAQNIKAFDAVLVAIGENVEGLLLTTVLLLELEVKRIIARAVNEQQRKILERLGVHNIISPENEVGAITAELMINPDMTNFMSLPDGYEIAEVRTPKKLIDLTLDEIDIEYNHDLQLITIKRYYPEQVKGLPTRELVPHLIRKPRLETRLKAADMLILFGKTSNIEEFLEVYGTM